MTPFSVWGLWGGLGGVQHLLQGAVIALALGAAFLPARRGLVEVAALAAAILIGLQMTLNYWLYPYIVWFFPLVIVALLASHPDRRDAPLEAWPDVTAARGAGADPDPDRLYLIPLAGTSSCSMAIARSGSSAVVISTAFSHGSSVEVSNRTGILVDIDSIACSRLTPITPPRGPVMPTSVM